MNLADFDALSFDCYGTLIDWEAGIGGYLEQLRALASNAPDIETLLTTFAEVESAAQRDHPTARYPEILARSLKGTGAAHGIAVPDDLANAFGASVPEWPAFPDSSAALHRLARQYKLIILSNIDRQSFAASNARLGVTFAAILTAEDIGSYKPDHRNFAALHARVEEMGIPRARLLHVAQSIFHDHVPAKALGMTTVWIDRRQGRAGTGATRAVAGPVTPDLTYPSMAAFADAVEVEALR